MNPLRVARRAGALAAAVALLGAAPALACSKDDTAYFDGFLDASCLGTLSSTTIDTFGGLRLTTNGAPVTTSWDTDTDFANGVAYEGTTYAPVGTSTLATTGSNAAAALQLPAAALPLAPDGATPLSPTASPALDDDNVDDPSVARVGSGYVMWYSGTAEDGSGPAIFEATSADGRAWTRANGGAPVLTASPGTFDARGVSGPDVLYDASDTVAPYRMYYAGDGDVFGAIGYATSTDGVTWVKHDGPMLDHGDPGSPDSFAAADPSVLKDGATWKMWYTGDDSSKKRIAYATSTDGITWTKGGKVISPEDPGANANYQFGAFAPTVYKLGDGSFEMLLTGRKLVSGTTFQTKVMDASSTDGITWTAPSPALNPSGTSTKFDFSNLNAPFVLPDPADSAAPFKLYYSGNTVDANGNFHTRIGYATSSNGTSFSKVTSGAGVNADNSVLDIGTPASAFDGRTASGPSVALAAAGSYAGIYWGARGSDFLPRLGEATSSDGSSWTKVPGGAKCGAASTGCGALFDLGNGFDQSGDRDPSLLHDTGTSTYDLYFTALNGATRSIGFASVAEDGTTHLPGASWSARSQVLAASGSGFDAAGVAHPSVVQSGSNFALYYTAIASGGATTIGRATATAAGGAFSGRSQVLAAGGPSGCPDAAGVKDPVVAKDSATWYMLYTGLETLADGSQVERVCYATSANGTSWTKQGVALDPSRMPYAPDETGAEPTGLLIDPIGGTLHAWTSGADRTGRTRGMQETATYPVGAGTLYSGWATYKLGDATKTVRDWRQIARTSSGGGLTLWMSFLQPYSSAGSEFWSAPFPVTAASASEALHFLLTVRGVRWEARMADPSLSPSLDRVDITHAPVSFSQSGSATTTDITPPAGQSTTRWGDLTVQSTMFQPGGGGSGGGTVTVADASSGAQLASAPLNTGGATTISLFSVDPASHPALHVTLALTSADGSATPLVQSLKILYNALAAPPPPPPPPPTVTLTASPAVITFGQPATLSGQLAQAGAPLAGASVSLLAEPAGTTVFAPLAGALTSATGAYSSVVSPSATTTYQASYPGVAAPPTAQVSVMHLVELKVTRKGTRGSFSGSVGPVEPGRPVLIQQQSGTTWKTIATLKTSSTSTFRMTKRLRSCARYRFKASAAADAQHLAGESAVVLVEQHRVTLRVTHKGRTVTFTGKVSPAHPRKVVILRVQKGTRFATLAKVRLSARSTFKLRKKLKRGSYAFRADMPADRCHFAGSSTVRLLKLR